MIWRSGNNSSYIEICMKYRTQNPFFTFCLVVLSGSRVVWCKFICMPGGVAFFHNVIFNWRLYTNAECGT